jgi:hypothetical protein
LIAAKKSPEEVIEDLYLRTLGRKPNTAETEKLVSIVRRESTDPKRIAEVAKIALGQDAVYKRGEERLARLREDLTKLPAGAKEAATLQKQIATLEQTQAATVQRYAGGAVAAVYGDILWGLFNSTEFTFNH